MSHEQPKPPTFGEQIAVGVGLATYLEGALYPWLGVAGTAGTHFYGLHALISVCIVMPLWISSIDGPDGRYAFWAMVSTLGMLVINRIFGIFRRDPSWHSFRRPAPRLFRKVGDKRKVALIAEPVFVVTLGFLASGFSRGLGSYLIFAGIAHFLTGLYSSASLAAKTRAIKDSQQEMLAQRAHYEETYRS